MRPHFRSDLVGACLPQTLLRTDEEELCQFDAIPPTYREKQSVPDGERPIVHIAIVCGLWQGASYSGAHPVFYFVLNLLIHGSQPYFSNILPARRLESNLHNAILFGIRRAFPDLAFDGFFALIVAGIAGVDYSGHRRASLRSVWGWM